MITIGKIIELFCITDSFNQIYESGVHNAIIYTSGEV